jgi:hypothetical protein
MPRLVVVLRAHPSRSKTPKKVPRVAELTSVHLKWKRRMQSNTAGRQANKQGNQLTERATERASDERQC